MLKFSMFFYFKNEINTKSIKIVDFNKNIFIFVGSTVGAKNFLPLLLIKCKTKEHKSKYGKSHCRFRIG